MTNRSTHGSEASVISDSLAGRRALVSGGSRGMGAAIVACLTAVGATAMTTARTASADVADPDLFITADVSTPEGTRAVVEQVTARLGTLDVLREHRRWLPLRPRRVRRARRRPVSGRRPVPGRGGDQPARRRSAGPRSHPGDDRGRGILVGRSGPAAQLGFAPRSAAVIICRPSRP